MRYFWKAVIPGALITAAILAPIKLIATGTTHGLTSGGWAVAVNALGWTLIIALMFWFYRREQMLRAMEDHARWQERRRELYGEDEDAT